MGHDFETAYVNVMTFTEQRSLAQKTKFLSWKKYIKNITTSTQKPE